MRRFAVLVLAFLAIPSAAFAACDGKDLRNEFPPETMREIRAGIADVPFREGIAFEAVHGDTRLTLFATVHSSDPAVFIPAEITARVRAADLVFVEATAEIEREMQQHLASHPSLLFDFDGPGLRTRLTAREWETLSTSLSAQGIKPESTDRMRPWFAAVMLAIPPCEKTARASGAKPLDKRVEMLARDVGVAVEGLDEDFEQALAFFLDASEEKELGMLRLSLATGAAEEGPAEDGLATAIGTWIDEEPLVTWELSRERTISLTSDREAVAALFRELHDYLVVRRNRAWLTKILSRIQEARNIVIAVGGMHLPGEQGLPRLLETAGFAVRRLAVF